MNGVMIILEVKYGKELNNMILIIYKVLRRYDVEILKHYNCDEQITIISFMGLIATLYQW